jgi:hypothetical protein
MGEGGKAKTLTEKKLLKMMNDKNITVNIIAEHSEIFRTREGERRYEGFKDDPNAYEPDDYSGGAYGGSTVSSDGKVTAFQYVDPTKLKQWDNRVGDSESGGYILHEFVEGYKAGQIAQYKGKGDGVGGSYYEKAHRRANKISGGGHLKTDHFTPWGTQYKSTYQRTDN